MKIRSIVSEVTFSAFPEDSELFDMYAVKVSWRSGDMYAVERRRQCLNADGVWDYEPVSSERADEWIAAHRFPYVIAASLAVGAVEDLVKASPRAQQALADLASSGAEGARA